MGEIPLAYRVGRRLTSWVPPGISWSARRWSSRERGIRPRPDDRPWFIDYSPSGRGADLRRLGTRARVPAAMKDQGLDLRPGRAEAQADQEPQEEGHRRRSR